MEYRYNKKETYSQEDVDKILENHTVFNGNKLEKEYVTIETYNKVVDELKPLKGEKRTSHIKSLVKDFTGDSKIDKLIKFSEIKDEDTDEEIIAKAQKLAKEDDYFQVAKPGAPEIVLEKKTIKQEESKKKDSKYKNL